jgi:hypothetical protein
MTRYNVSSDVPVIFTVEADSEDEAKAKVEHQWGDVWHAMSDAVTRWAQWNEPAHLGEWYDDTDVSEADDVT